MLNPFPIQFLALLAYFLLRISVSSVLSLLAYNHIKHRQTLSYRLKISPLLIIGLALLELVIAAFLIIGMYTQYAVLALLALIPFYILLHRRQKIPLYISIILLGAAAISLFITGAGAFAVDLPI